MSYISIHSLCVLYQVFLRKQSLAKYLCWSLFSSNVAGLSPATLSATVQRCFKKRYSEKMQQIYRRTPMSKLQSNFIEITLRHGCFAIHLLHIFRTSFLKNTCGWLLLFCEKKFTISEFPSYPFSINCKFSIEISY